MTIGVVPKISVGILQDVRVRFKLNGKYECVGEIYQDVEGEAILLEGKIAVYVGAKNIGTYDGVYFSAQTQESFIAIFDVVIGIGFHWERKENQSFIGDLQLLDENGKVRAVNVLPLEAYLESVISSEMSATASDALLKAHAVISRSWLLAQLARQKELTEGYSSVKETEQELVKWYGREDHELFDVCADDHCQRYQGITRIGAQGVVDAVRETAGEVLMYEGEICDARFSKCCGGVVESFENVWEPEKKEYLPPLYDDVNEEIFDLDLQNEKKATKFIMENPEAFCNTQNSRVLSEVMNDYDQETHDFFRWTVRYTQEELSELVKERSGVDYGVVEDLQPVERGFSGRLIRLRIVGTQCTKIIGKELEIRKTLSPSHLYSSAFIVKREGTDFVLRGAGWGHGVGLCQIGAAVMGAKGYDYKEILLHYFKNVELKRYY